MSGISYPVAHFKQTGGRLSHDGNSGAQLVVQARKSQPLQPLNDGVVGSYPLNAVDFSDMKAGLAEIAEEFKGWALQLIALITDGETDPVLRPSTRIFFRRIYHLDKF